MWIWKLRVRSENNYGEEHLQGHSLGLALNNRGARPCSGGARFNPSSWEAVAEDHCEFKARWAYRASSRITKATQRNCLKITRHENKKKRTEALCVKVP